MNSLHGKDHEFAGLIHQVSVCNYTESKVLLILDNVYSNQLSSSKQDNGLTQHIILLKENNIDADEIERYLQNYFLQKNGTLIAQIWSQLRTHIIFSDSPNIPPEIFSQLLVAGAPLTTRVEITMKDGVKLIKDFQIQLSGNLHETGLEKMNFFLSEIDNYIRGESQKLKGVSFQHEVRGKII